MIRRWPSGWRGSTLAGLRAGAAGGTAGGGGRPAAGRAGPRGRRPGARAPGSTSAPGQAGRLLLAIHHLAVDGVSWRILLEDLLAAYARLGRGEAAALPPRTTSFQRWAGRLAAARPDRGDPGRAAATGRRSARGCRPCRSTTIPPRRRTRSDAGGAPGERAAGGGDPAAAGRGAGGLPQPDQRRAADGAGAGGGALAARSAAGRRRRPCLLELEGHGRAEELFGDVDLSRTVGWFTSLFPVRLDPGWTRPGWRRRWRAGRRRGGAEAGQGAAAGGAARGHRLWPLAPPQPGDRGGAGRAAAAGAAVQLPGPVRPAAAGRGGGRRLGAGRRGGGRGGGTGARPRPPARGQRGGRGRAAAGRVALVPRRCTTPASVAALAERLPGGAARADPRTA